MPSNFIIAEAGTCHASEDCYDRAVHYIVEAHKAGANAVKFQIFDNPTEETMFCWIEGDKERSVRWHESRMSLDEWKKIKKGCDRLGILFLASVFEYETVKWLSELGVQATKVASRAAGSLDAFKDAPRPLLVSNGMYEVDPAPETLIIQCEANYPSTAWWDDKYKGFSDHSGNTERAIDAMIRGCELIEVHFYINPEDAGPDFAASLTLEELKEVCKVRDAM